MGGPTDPGLLWAYQIERRKQWDMIYLIMVILSLVAPVGFAITRLESSQILKIFYPFFALFIALPALGLASATSFLSALFSLAACALVVVILMPGIQWVIGTSPSPEWYILILPLLIFLYLATESFIPQKENIEWANINLSPDLLDKRQLSILNEKSHIGKSARKVYKNIFSMKPESVWTKSFRHFAYRQRGKSVQLESQHSINASKALASTEQQISGTSSSSMRALASLDELYALQLQVDDSLQKLRAPYSAQNMEMSAGNDQRRILQVFQQAQMQNDMLALRDYNPIELIISGETANSWMRGAENVVAKLEIVKTGGTYLLVQQSGNWLFPTFESVSRLSSNQSAHHPGRGIFVLQRESIAAPELRRPAEVKQVGDLWEVVTLGLIAVPA